jgi:hypothetical protein
VNTEIVNSNFSGNTPTSLGGATTEPFVGTGDTGLPPGAVVPPPPYAGG